MKRNLLHINDGEHCWTVSNIGTVETPTSPLPDAMLPKHPGGAE